MLRILISVAILTPHAPQAYRYFLFNGTLIAVVFGGAVIVLGIICSIVTWQMAFVEERTTRFEGVIGAIDSLACAALSASLLVNGDPLSLPMTLATLFVMVNIAMTERVVSEQRLQERLRKLGPLIYIGGKAIEHPAPTESLSLSGKKNNEKADS